MANEIPTVTLRWRLTFSAVLVSMCLPAGAQAEPIVVANRSAASGFVSVFDPATATVIAETMFSSPVPASPTGIFAFADIATLFTGPGPAGGNVIAGIATDISPTLFASSGFVDASAFQPTPPAGAAAVGTSASQIDFALTQPHAYAYRGEFSLALDGFFPELTSLLSTNLTMTGNPDSTVFSTILASSSGFFVPPGIHIVEHAGVLGPGNYVISSGLASIFAVTSPTADSLNGQLGFNATFSLTPVSDPIPEPATLVLLGTGVVCLAARRVRQRCQ
jgi:PEP-CTERM motif-containing protein